MSFDLRTVPDPSEGAGYVEDDEKPMLIDRRRFVATATTAAVICLQQDREPSRHPVIKGELL
jgi:hypothetical protein